MLSLSKHGGQASALYPSTGLRVTAFSIHRLCPHRRFAFTFGSNKLPVRTQATGRKSQSRLTRSALRWTTLLRLRRKEGKKAPSMRKA
ncbi:hypothetical protein SAMN05428975_5036 [Mucilaginibacter sp. OK268]|nr:hypothetical protein SAMN05428975_5036 [Mucilaginibacter sp. OK268]